MGFIADLHIHSRFSMATSKQLRPEYLDYWARMKGIKVVGTGDFTHPGWLAELKEKLEPAEPGLYKLKHACKLDHILPETPGNAVRFILTAEISNIYKKHGQVRKIHSVLFAPDFDTVEKIQQKLSTMHFNITSDGRPILGLDVRDLLEITLDIHENNFFVPAHIWTPWFSVFGSKSGFDTIEACFEETGLSTDPPMNWMCSFLDDYTLISNSDAHSPEKLGRNANLFNSPLSYDAMIQAMKTGDPDDFGGTFDMYPQEGKYHYDGHRKCGVRWSPLETLKNQGICPVCGKKVTVGVTNRVVKLSDRENIMQRKNRLPYYSIIPLKEILSEIEGVGENSKKVAKRYEQLIRKAGTEFNILHYLPVEELQQAGGEVLAEAIRRMRNNEVIIKEGYDGEYGQIKVFQPDEIRYLGNQESLFDTSGNFQNPGKRQLINFDLKAYRRLEKMDIPVNQAAEEKAPYHTTKKSHLLEGLNAEQTKAASHGRGPAAVLAGPGTGKTKVLTRRIAYLITEKQIEPSRILAITFTNKAAGEMKNRCKKLLSQDTPASDPTVATFHAFGYQLLKTYNHHLPQDENFTLIHEPDKIKLISEQFQIGEKEAKKFASHFAAIKQYPPGNESHVDNNLHASFQAYQKQLADYNLFDLDDLIYQSVTLLKENPDLHNHITHQYPWILIDEFQDINPMQYQMIRLLGPGKDANLFIIGDPNQAIYGFRGSNTRFISRMMEDYLDTEVYKLHTSYRCSQNILNASGDVLEEKGLEGLREGVKIKISPQQTDKSEAEFIARTIEALSGGLRFFSMDSNVTQGNTDEQIESLSDFAILCRTKKQMAVIENALLNHTIPCQAVSEDAFFHHPLVKDVTSMIEYTEKPGNRFLQLKLEKILDSGQSIHHALNTIQALDGINDKIQCAYDMLIRKDPGRHDQELLQYLLKLGSHYTGNIREFLRYLALGSENDAYDSGTEKVALMTLHASKGLEFQCVFIAGCEDGLIPYSIYTTQDTDREEEKRLLYVGMTRAKSYLYLTHAKKRYFMGRERSLSRSPFLNRIEKALTEMEKNTYRKKHPEDAQLKLF